MFKKLAPQSATSGQSPSPLDQRMRLQNRLRSGASWFYWIAALSLINGILIEVGSSINFIFGLGVTQLVDALVFMFGQDLNSDSFLVLRILGWVMILLIIVIFILFGVFAYKRQRWAFIAGIVVYALDALLILFIWEQPDLLSFAFHLIALWSLVRGFRTIGQLESLENTMRQSGLLPPEPQPSVIQPA